MSNRNRNTTKTTTAPDLIKIRPDELPDALRSSDTLLAELCEIESMALTLAHVVDGDGDPGDDAFKDSHVCNVLDAIRRKAAAATSALNDFKDAIGFDAEKLKAGKIETAG